MKTKKDNSNRSRLVRYRGISALMAALLALTLTHTAFANEEGVSSETVMVYEVTLKPEAPVKPLTGAETTTAATGEDTTTDTATTPSDSTLADTSSETSTPASDSTSATEPASTVSASSSGEDTTAVNGEENTGDSGEETSAPEETTPEETTVEETTAAVLVVRQKAVDLSSIRATMPEGLSAIRQKLVLKAYSLVGQVGYFWGGKSGQLGWDSRWGQIATVAIEGSKSTGTARSYGLDCSGFIGWVFCNAFEDNSVARQVGENTADQWGLSDEISWAECQPGDLVFRQTPASSGTNHVGVIVEIAESGEIWVAHCASSRNNVVVTEAVESGFRYVRKPHILLNSCECTWLLEEQIMHSPECEAYTGLNSSSEAKNKRIWEDLDQLTLDLRCIFQDEVLAGAVAESLWNTYGEGDPTAMQSTAGFFPAPAEGLAKLQISDIEIEIVRLNLESLGYDNLLEIVKAADITVSAQGEAPRDTAEAAKALPAEMTETGGAETAETEAAGEAEEIPQVQSLEGIQYLQSARRIDVSYNAIISLMPLDYTRTNRAGEAVYNQSFYYQENGEWIQDPEGNLHKDDSLRLYFGGGLPGSEEEYSTVLVLTGNPVTEVPAQFPGRLSLENLQIVIAQN